MKTFSEVFGGPLGDSSQPSLRGENLESFGLKGNSFSIKVEQGNETLFDSFIPQGKGLAVKKRRFWHRRFRVLGNFGKLVEFEGGFYDLSRAATLTVEDRYGNALNVVLPPVLNRKSFAIIVVRHGANTSLHYYGEQ